MEKISLLSSKQQEVECEKKTDKKQPDRIGELTHELANQLTVINLGCVNLRHALTIAVTSGQLPEIGWIEAAAQKASDLVETLRSTIEKRPLLNQVEQPAQGGRRSIPQANVYVISRGLRLPGK